ncbi:MAG: tyrosine-type recombinase/integrase [Bacteroidetes bacterium]|nr:MAG: tyrosine-type recombinase/integrase [Bacteroidota bacterium]
MIEQRIPSLRIHAESLTGISPEWVGWCQRWLNTSPIRTRKSRYNEILLVGRWLAQTHPAITSPIQWTRQTAIDYVATVSRMRKGDWSLWDEVKDRGQPLSMRTKLHKLSHLRSFFRDCQTWGWIPHRFSPDRYLALAPSAAEDIPPKPRVLDDEVWAKLVWAGLNLESDDLPRYGRQPASGFLYPFTFWRAAAIAWLFGGLRASELRRLRLDCIRWEQDEQSRICWLDVPPAKSHGGHTRPVDGVVGDAVQAWAAERPVSEPILDKVTGEYVQLLFQFHQRYMGMGFLNNTLIPLLCAKAGIPERDSQGTITSHRARATIATHLANAPKPMPLVVLQDWLGHSSPQATLQYVKAKPITLTHAYQRAEYLARNVRTMTVFLDRETIESGIADEQTPWKYYDLGHGYCTYDFFEQCPHRMACARCSFYRPKPELFDQLMANQQRYLQMLQEIPLTETEQLAVESDLKAVQHLVNQLRHLPMPDGTLPSQSELLLQSGFIPLDQIR